MSDPIVIVGGGLSGLYAARLLAAAGLDFLLLEAQGRLGGRILSVTDDGFDLGPTWFWPDMQPVMARLIAELGLASFAQYSEGDVLIERAAREPVQRFAGFGQMASSFRIAGGTGALVAALAKQLPQDRIRRNVTVTGAALRGDGVSLATRDGQTVIASRVLFAVPPRLLERTVTFTPAIDPGLQTRWRQTPTWMAPHAKFLAVYEKPFWRDSGLSGTAQSMIGPMVEIHDASAMAGRAALFGFLGVPAAARQQIGEEALKRHCQAQFARLFGPQAPVATFLKDWSADGLTATADDREAGEHPTPVSQPWFDPIWAHRAVMAGSETAPEHP
ncbi:MAG: FAD-dependent oxidoreductase, partial [Rhizomicrobium sp.]